MASVNVCVKNSFRCYLFLVVMFSGFTSLAQAADAELTRFLHHYSFDSAEETIQKDQFFGTAGDATLEVEAVGKATSMSISLNNSKILKSNAIKWQGGKTLIPITLLAGDSNQLEVRLNGKSASSVKVRVRQHASVDFQFNNFTTYAGNTANFEKSKVFYQRLGFTTVLGGFPKTNTLEMGQALGAKTAYELRDGALMQLTYGHQPSWIDLIEWVDPHQDGAPYSNLNHLGMVSAAYVTTDIDADYFYLKSAGVKFLSAPVGEAGSRFGRYVFLKDLDGTFIQLIQIPGELPPNVCDSATDDACPVTHLTRTRHISINVTDFESAREYFRLLGFTESSSLPSMSTKDEAKAMGLNKPFKVIAADISIPANALPEGDPGVSIRLTQWVSHFDPDPTYPLPITHYGIQRLVMLSEAGDNLMATKVKTLMGQGIKMVSEGAPCCSGKDSEGGIVLWHGPDDIYLETGGAFKPAAK